MWKAIKNVVSAAGNIAAIAKIETQYQVNKASTKAASITEQLSSKAATIRAQYESDLADRKAGIIKPTVVEEIPKDAVPVNNHQ
jgi:hypothetical protein